MFHEKRRFPLRVSLVNGTKSSVKCRLFSLTRGILKRKHHFQCNEISYGLEQGRIQHPVNLQKQPPDVFYKKGVLKNSAKFTGKYLRQSLSFNKVVWLSPAFSCEFCEIYKNTFLTEHLWWLLKIIYDGVCLEAVNG